MDITNEAGWPTTSRDEYSAIKLMVECAQKAYGEINIDPSPELFQAHQAYHIWRDGQLICWFSIEGAFAVVRVWSPYQNRHFGNSREYPAMFTKFNLADPDNERIVRHFSYLGCDCGTRHQGRESQRLHQD